MPLVSFSSDEAARNLRSNRASLWPDGRISGTRLEGLASVSLKPRFTFTRADRILTIGSCFAREIEKHLHKLGFDLPALAVGIPAEERAGKTANSILNKYTVHSMENELRWATQETGIAPEDFYLTAGEGKWHDAQMVHNLAPASLERVIERRAQVSAMMRRLPDCRIIVITLGLAEAWFDTRTGLYLNGMPPAAATRHEPDRFRLDVLTHDEILASLERIHDILTRTGHPDFRMLVTVSPVPFKATFWGRDALLANTYGKSAQRAAVDAFAARHDNVDYFPSYEIVTLSDRTVAYELDNIHVTPPAVSHIMATVLAAYVPGQQADTTATKAAGTAPTRVGPASQTTLQAQAKGAMLDEDYARAVTLFTDLLQQFGDRMTVADQAAARTGLGVALLRAGSPEDGAGQLKLAKALVPDDPPTTYRLGLYLAQANLHAEALALLREAYDARPGERDYAWRLGAQLIRMGQAEDGVRHLRLALAIDPGHEPSLRALARHARRTGGGGGDGAARGAPGGVPGGAPGGVPGGQGPQDAAAPGRPGAARRFREGLLGRLGQFAARVQGQPLPGDPPDREKAIARGETRRNPGTGG